MAASSAQSIEDESNNNQKLKKRDEDEEYQEMVRLVPKEKGWITKCLLKYQGAWLTPMVLKGVIMAQDQFMALPGDIVVATSPRSGFTWLQALVFAVLNRASFDLSAHPLLTKNPHECIPSLEILYLQNQQYNRHDQHPQSRVFSTRTPYHILPDSFRSTPGGKVVYMVRDPKDVLVSSWHYAQKLRPKELPPLSLEEAFDMFCRGVFQFGSHWDHVLGYYNASLENPNKVLILRYEDMKREPLGNVMKLAKHLGSQFSAAELREGVVEEIAKLCSFETLSNLEVNKSGVQQFTTTIAIENHVFFRKGGVGDWENHLTSEMARRLDQITNDSFQGTGLL